MTPPDSLPIQARKQFRDILGPSHVIEDHDRMVSFTRDWTGRFLGATPAVLRPGTTGEVAAVIEVCAAEGIAVVPQGGNTGLVGGGVPLGGEIVLSTTRLTSVGDVTPTGQLTVGAGVTIGAIQQMARAAGWEYGVDLASRDSATVGGTVSTNAGGLRVLRYGDTRDQVAGIEAVLGHGGVVSHLDGLKKDNTGYPLHALLCGSEGTLGIVTAVCLRLVPPTPERVTALLAFDGPSAIACALAAAHDMRRSVPHLDGLELFMADGLDLVCSFTGAVPPFPDHHDVYLLAEVADRVDPSDELSEAVHGLSEVAAVAVATDSGRRRDLWHYREAHAEAVNSVSPPHKLDVTLPAVALGTFIAEVPRAIAAAHPGSQTWLWGHVGDGNIHVNVTGVDSNDDGPDEVVFRLAASCGGSISAEHGIGTAKRSWLHLNRSDTEIAAFRSIKRALDPAGILNPNVLLPT